MSTTDSILEIAVLGVAIGVTVKSFELFSKPIKASKNKIKNIWGF